MRSQAIEISLNAVKTDGIHSASNIPHAKLKPNVLRNVTGQQMLSEVCLPKNPSFYKDRTNEFLSSRNEKSENRKLEKIILRKRFLQLVSLKMRLYLLQDHNSQSNFLKLANLRQREFSKQNVIEAEMEIVGTENWQDDKSAPHCSLCSNSFGFFNRKHHCRLCGRVVDAYSENIRDSCSAQVPLVFFLQKLPHLNYHPDIRANWDTLCMASPNPELSNLFSFRCCKNCKNIMIGRVRKEDLSRDDTLFENYSSFLSLKTRVLNIASRYSIDSFGKLGNDQIIRYKSKLVECIKDLESITLAFQRNIDHPDKPEQARPKHVDELLMKNFYRCSMLFLLETIELLRDISDTSGSEPEKLSDTGEKRYINSPRMDETSINLNKRQIRLQREQLMVLKEQKFIIEGLIQETRANRKFDEVSTLEQNSEDLNLRISELEAYLGEYRF